MSPSLGFIWWRSSALALRNSSNFAASLACYPRLSLYNNGEEYLPYSEEMAVEFNKEPKHGVEHYYFDVDPFNIILLAVMGSLDPEVESIVSTTHFLILP